MSALDEYEYLWEGSEPGWRLQSIDFSVHTVTIEFGDSGPALSDISTLRNLLDEFRDMPIQQLWRQLKGLRSYTIPRGFTNLEMRPLVERAKNARLSVRVDGVQRGGYLPISADGGALIIEDDDIARQVAEKMIAAGVPIDFVHVD